MSALRTLDSLVNCQQNVVKNNGAGLRLGRMAAWGIKSSMRGAGAVLDNYAPNGSESAKKE
jgi:hypothetical protein